MSNNFFSKSNYLTKEKDTKLDKIIKEKDDIINNLTRELNILKGKLETYEKFHENDRQTINNMMRILISNYNALPYNDDENS